MEETRRQLEDRTAALREAQQQVARLTEQVGGWAWGREQRVGRAPATGRCAVMVTVALVVACAIC